MKKIVKIFLMMLVLVFSTQVAFAEKKDVLEEVAPDIIEYRTLALMKPLYIQVGGDPTMEELMKAVNEASKEATQLTVIPYEEIEMKFLREKNIDLSQYDRRTAARFVKRNVASIAPVYVVLTVANNNKTMFFFDVYNSKTHELLFDFAMKTDSGDNFEAYRHMAHTFFMAYQGEIREQMKAKEKAMFDLTLTDKDKKRR